MSSRKSTNDRTSVALPKLGGVRLAFGALELIAPAAGARWAERLWFTLPTVPAAARRARVDLPPGETFAVEVHGRRVRGTIWGSGPTVYLVHGWGGWGLQLAAYAPPLVAAGFRVVAYDAPSHGDSDPGRDGPGTTALPEIADALRAVVAQQGPAYAVVAHSIGAAATAHAMRDGLTAERIVFVAAAQSFEHSVGLFERMFGFGPRTRARLLERFTRRFGVPIDYFDVTRVAAEVLGDQGSLPALLAIHDADDRETPHGGSVAIAEAWPGARLRTTDGLGHRQVLWHPTLVGEVAGFVSADAVAAENRGPAQDRMAG